MKDFIFDLFTNPIVTTSLIGTVCMSFSSALVGAMVVIKRRSLIGETLAHAAFPGILVGFLLTSFFTKEVSEWMFLGMTLGGLFFALLGLEAVNLMERRFQVKPDSALTFVLASFMGWGILLVSIVQQFSPIGYRQATLYLYGQAVTMSIMQAMLYGGFAVILTLFICSSYGYLKIINFDPSYAQTLGIRYHLLEKTTFFCIVIAIILGIRSVGVVLMAGMLIGPALAARPWANSFSSLLIGAGFFGVISGLLGNVLSLKFSSKTLSFPTGPMILLAASSLCVISLLIAPQNGFLIRLIRMQLFRFRCAMDNHLKLLWKKKPFKVQLPFIIRLSLRSKGLITCEGALTPEGEKEAQKIVRLHRLWEVYLVEYLGQNVDKVHHTAEELEHLFSPALEKQLSELLNYPSRDPHQQPIPPRL